MTTHKIGQLLAQLENANTFSDQRQYYNQRKKELLQYVRQLEDNQKPKPAFNWPEVSVNPDFLSSVWNKVFESSSTAEAAFNTVYTYWTGHASRYYHTTQHLAECLALAELWNAPLVVKVALWYHDAVYDPTKKYNEEMSAVLAVGELDGLLSSQEISVVEKLILATKTHERSSLLLSDLMLDIDMAILGSPPARYKQYAKDIRAEFDFVPGKNFCEGRFNFLLRIEKRERIYFTDEAYNALEKQARENIQLEMKELLEEVDSWEQ